jgi:hypothetical protein
LVRIRHGDLKGFADLRPVFDARPRRNGDHHPARGTDAARLHGGRRVNLAAVGEQRSFAQHHLAPPAQAALAAARVERQVMRGEQFGQRARVVAGQFDLAVFAGFQFDPHC